MSLRNLGLNSTFRGLFTKGHEMGKTVQTVLDFKSQPQESLDSIMVRTDQELGGFSTANFNVDAESGAGHFHGYLNLDLPKDNPAVTRSGYAMFRTKDQKESWLSGNSYWDWSHLSSVVLRVQGDRRKYLVNIQANTPLVTDLFQHRLFLNHPGEWETVVIPLQDFVMTNWGVIQDGSEINKAEIKTIGVGLLDKQYGPFSLKVDWIKVMTGTEVERETRRARTERLSISTPPKDQQNGGIEASTEASPFGSSAMPSTSNDDPKNTVF
ncbi:CIA30-domain-containing protein [Suhomyces tanzawaensis NRRL Y-17324]|uniref:CIA30-domain-containing protein n=1 Tax=Suhomyces tanzawaensis NRRL Y-17324 TaxID=984487 RepID=A0A1E4SDI2_9ASCO|nr:CIA30-domain-containing protein [Suhomyces tanzawaensis NRRL Y-17324]ODV77579.1 CIA30-domain-containing protein [Suhomyces tanzawaensis NRRL Y-17324]